MKHLQLQYTATVFAKTLARALGSKEFYQLDEILAVYYLGSVDAEISFWCQSENSIVSQRRNTIQVKPKKSRHDHQWFVSLILGAIENRTRKTYQRMIRFNEIRHEKTNHNCISSQRTLCVDFNNSIAIENTNTHNTNENQRNFRTRTVFTIRSTTNK